MLDYKGEVTEKMKFFTNNNFIRKLMIAIVCVILLNFCFAPTAKAASNFGGKMMGYMRSFSVGIADVVASLVQFGVTGKWSPATGGAGTGKPSGSDYWVKESKFEYPILQISPELIFANQVQLLDINFISPISNENYLLSLEDTSVLETLRNIIAGWYVTLRTIAVVGLLSVLIYIGIRIIISSTSGDKAKYKEKLLDWIIAFCLLFFMHYIMAATITIVNEVNHVLGASIDLDVGIEIDEDYGEVKYQPLSGEEISEDEKWKFNLGDIFKARTSIWDVVIEVAIDAIQDNIEVSKNRTNIIEEVKEKAEAEGGTYLRESNDWKTVSESEIVIRGKKIKQYDIYYEEFTMMIWEEAEDWRTTGLQNVSTKTTYSYAKKNTDDDKYDNITDSETQTINGLRISDEPDRVFYFINYARLFVNAKDDNKYIPTATAYLIIYIALVSFTAVFTFRYIKRVIYIAFLTMIAPMVALTYPLDKLKDRKSTGMEHVV